MDIKEPVRVMSFEELNQGDRIWNINSSGQSQILTFVMILPKTMGSYAIFTDMNHNGVPKIHKSELEGKFWYKYEDSDLTWYHIYTKLYEWHKDEAKWAKKQAEFKKNRIISDGE